MTLLLVQITHLCSHLNYTVLVVKRNNIIITCIIIPRSHLIKLIIIIYKLTKTYTLNIKQIHNSSNFPYNKLHQYIITQESLLVLNNTKNHIIIPSITNRDTNWTLWAYKPKPRPNNLQHITIIHAHDSNLVAINLLWPHYTWSMRATWNKTQHY